MMEKRIVKRKRMKKGLIKRKKNKLIQQKGKNQLKAKSLIS